jgi:hypothetical protein
MKPETEKRIGIIVALILIILSVYKNSSKAGTVILSIDALLLVGYILALVFKKIIIVKGMFTFFAAINLMTLGNLPSEILREPKKYIFVSVFTVVMLGASIFLLGLGIRGANRIMEKESKSEENLLKHDE